MAIKVKMHRIGKDNLRASIYQNFAMLNRESQSIVMEESFNTIQESLNEVPIMTGTLASIAEVVPTVDNIFKLSVQVGYGITKDSYNEASKAYAKEYMLKVHEDLQAHHTHGKAKFLEDPVNRARIRIAERLRDTGRRYFK